MSSTNPSLQNEKKVLRKSIKERLAKLPLNEVVGQSSKMTAAVLRLPAYLKAERISVFLSMPVGEVSTHEIVVQALNHGKTVFVPYIHEVEDSSSTKRTNTMDMLALRSKEDLESLKRDAWGIPTLDEGSVAARENALCVREAENSATQAGEAPRRSAILGLDLMFVPGVAFDTQNRRLGHGKGYYDRYLQRYKDAVSSEGNALMPRLVGLALKEQMLPHGSAVPSGDNDWVMDEVISGARG